MRVDEFIPSLNIEAPISTDILSKLNVKYRLLDEKINLLNANKSILKEFGVKSTIDYRL